MREVALSGLGLLTVALGVVGVLVRVMVGDARTGRQEAHEDLLRERTQITTERADWNLERLAFLERLDALRAPVIGPPSPVQDPGPPTAATEAGELDVMEDLRRHALLAENL